MKLYNFFVVLLLVGGLVSAADVQFNYIPCTRNLDCPSNKPYCWAYSPSDDMECHSFQGKRSYKCPSGEDDSCIGTLKCVIVPNRGYACSECETGEKSFGGVEYLISRGEVNKKSDSDRPYDITCLDPLTTCTCSMYEPDGNSRSYGRWNSQDDLCDPCHNNDECYTGRCVEVDNGDIKRCLDVDDVADLNFCCKSGDCYSGESCVTVHSVYYPEDGDTHNAGECYNLDTQSTTTTTVTTTTSTTTTTTTTTLDAGIDDTCMLQTPIIQGIDDGYEIHPLLGYGNGTWISDGSLILYNSSDVVNRTFAFTFRDFQMPRNATDITSAKLYLRFKSVGDGSFSTTHGTYALENINIGDLDNQTKPSELDSVTSYDRYYEETDGIYYYMDLSTSYGVSSTNWMGVSDDEWTDTNPYDKTDDLSETIHFFNNGTYKKGDNITIVIKVDSDNEADEDVYFYSYEDGSPPVLCVNYTTQKTFKEVYEDESCSQDENCDINEFCRTGWSEVSYCKEKYDNYLVDPYMRCYKDHECLSGSCSTDYLNSGDYPIYDDTKGVPYDHHGVCLPVKYDMDLRVIPSSLGFSDSFKVVGSVTDDNTPVYMQSCWVQFGRIEGDSEDAWAYVGNKTSDNEQYFMSNQGDTHWNYMINDNPIVRGSIAPGTYKYMFVCTEPTGQEIIKLSTANILANNDSFISIIDKPELSMNLGTTFRVTVQHLNITGKPLADSSCIVEFENVNHSMEEVRTPTGESKYYTDLTTSLTGFRNIKLYCNLTDYENAYASHQYHVQSNHCQDNALNFGEEGIDCGGSDCLPCEDDNDLKDVYMSCSGDIECQSGWCHPVNKVCDIPTCYDGYWNNGEVQTDCGGYACDKCSLCLDNSDCSFDGSQYCNATGLYCQYHNCTDNEDCAQLEYGGIIRETTCDTNLNLCKFYYDTTGNQTVQDLGMDILPLSRNIVNKSGTLLNVVNCEDKTNGFKITTKEKTKIFYTFESTTLNPSLDSYSNNEVFAGGEYSKVKTGFIDELCQPNSRGFGGFGKDEDILYTRIKFTSNNGKLVHDRYIDVVCFKNNFETSLKVFDPRTKDQWDVFRVNASDREIYMYAKGEPHGEWRNVTTDYQVNIEYNASIDTISGAWTNHFYYKINSSFGEVFEGSKSDMVDSIMFMKWNRDTHSIDFNLPFAVGGWIIWIILPLIIIGTVYMLYQLRRRQGGV